MDASAASSHSCYEGQKAFGIIPMKNLSAPHTEGPNKNTTQVKKLYQFVAVFPRVWKDMMRIIPTNTVNRGDHGFKDSGLYCFITAAWQATIDTSHLVERSIDCQTRKCFPNTLSGLSSSSEAVTGLQS